MNTLTKTEDRASAQSSGNGRRTSFLTPLANIRETRDGYVLEVEMPGVSKGGLEVSFENNQLVLWGRRSETEVKGEIVYRESRPLDFHRAFDLDPSIDASRITAKIEQGLVTLTLPKAESVKPRKIAVTE